MTANLTEGTREFSTLVVYTQLPFTCAGVMLILFTLFVVFKHQKLQREFRVLLCAQELADLGYMLTLLESEIRQVIKGSKSATIHPQCKISESLLLFFFNASASGTLLIAVFRSFGIFRPAIYNMLTKSTIVTAAFLVSVWQGAVLITWGSLHEGFTRYVVCSIFTITSRRGNFTEGAFMFVSSAALIVIYLSVYWKLAQMRNSVRIRQKNTTLKKKRKHLPCDFKYSKTIFSITINLFHCFFFIPIGVYFVFMGTCFSESDHGLQNTLVFKAMIGLPQMIFLLNPILFYWHMRSVRKIAIHRYCPCAKNAFKVIILSASLDSIIQAEPSEDESPLGGILEMLSFVRSPDDDDDTVQQDQNVQLDGNKMATEAKLAASRIAQDPFPKFPLKHSGTQTDTGMTLNISTQATSKLSEAEHIQQPGCSHDESFQHSQVPVHKRHLYNSKLASEPASPSHSIRDRYISVNTRWRSLSDVISFQRNKDIFVHRHVNAAGRVSHEALHHEREVNLAGKVYHCVDTDGTQELSAESWHRSGSPDTDGPLHRVNANLTQDYADTFLGPDGSQEDTMKVSLDFVCEGKGVSKGANWNQLLPLQVIPTENRQSKKSSKSRSPDRSKDKK